MITVIAECIDAYLFFSFWFQTLISMMSGNALRDLNTLPTSERKNGYSNKGNFTKPCNGNTIENVEEHQKKSPASVHINGGETVNAGAEVAILEVEYIESENLSDLEDVDTCLEVKFSISLLLHFIS